jgi:hypothetical protein
MKKTKKGALIHQEEKIDYLLFPCFQQRISSFQMLIISSHLLNLLFQTIPQNHEGYISTHTICSFACLKKGTEKT